MTSESRPTPPRSLQILVLDDDYRWRHLVAYNVEIHLGISPVRASSGKEALEIMAERPFDVVISDLFMPEMDGFQFLKHVRGLFLQTKVVLLSGDFDSFYIPRQRLIEQGAFAAIPKDEISTTLQDLLQDLLEGN